MTGEEGHVTSLTSWRAACDISARSFGLPTNYERPIYNVLYHQLCHENHVVKTYVSFILEHELPSQSLITLNFFLVVPSKEYSTSEDMILKRKKILLKNLDNSP